MHKLKKPWGYIISISEIYKLANELRYFYEEIYKDLPSEDSRKIPPDESMRSMVLNSPPKGSFLITNKIKGVHISATLHASYYYTSESRWIELRDKFREIIQNHLGNEVVIDFCEDYYTDKYCRLYSSLDTYIFFKEYLPIQEKISNLNSLEISEFKDYDIILRTKKTR